MIDNSKLNKINCNIKANDVIELNNIKSKIYNLSQIKSIATKKISLNNNLQEIDYFGNLTTLKKSINSLNLFIDDSDKCYIFK